MTPILPPLLCVLCCCCMLSRCLLLVVAPRCHVASASAFCCGPPSGQSNIFIAAAPRQSCGNSPLLPSPSPSLTRCALRSHWRATDARSAIVCAVLFRLMEMICCPILMQRIATTTTTATAVAASARQHVAPTMCNKSDPHP